ETHTRRVDKLVIRRLPLDARQGPRHGMIRLAVATAEPFPFADRVVGAAVETCSPDDEAAVERCLASGQHVLLTAPSAFSEARLDRLLATARRSGAQLALFNPERFRPAPQL